MSLLPRRPHLKARGLDRTLQAPIPASEHVRHKSDADALSTLDAHVTAQVIAAAARGHEPIAFVRRLVRTCVGRRRATDHDLCFATTWAAYHQRVSRTDPRTLAECYAHERGLELADPERAFLDAQAKAWLSMWEIRGIRRGVGLSLRDLLTREERFVYYDTRGMSQGDVLLARVLDHEGVSTLSGVHRWQIPLDVVNEMSWVRPWGEFRPLVPEDLRAEDVTLDLARDWELEGRAQFRWQMAC